MSSNNKSWLSIGWLVLSCVALSGCPAPDKEAQTVLTNTTEQLNPEISRLFFDIAQAQRIERSEPGAKDPEDSIRYEFGTDSLHKNYSFPNLRALRTSIKHRMNSLRAAGIALSYDTVLGAPVQGSLRERPVNRDSTIKNQTAVFLHKHLQRPYRRPKSSLSTSGV